MLQSSRMLSLMVLLTYLLGNGAQTHSCLTWAFLACGCHTACLTKCSISYGEGASTGGSKFSVHLMVRSATVLGSKYTQFNGDVLHRSTLIVCHVTIWFWKEVISICCNMSTYTISITVSVAIIMHIYVTQMLVIITDLYKMQMNKDGKQLNLHVCCRSYF